MRPRYGRIASALTSLGITAVSVLGAAGVLPGVGGPSAVAATDAVGGLPDSGLMTLTGYAGPVTRVDLGTPTDPVDQADPLDPLDPTDPTFAGSAVGGSGDDSVPPSTASDAAVLPPGSGQGKRVVFDMSDQRVWLVGRGGKVHRTYLVSGSLTDNLRPGTYEVYSTSRHAIGIDDSGTMQFMVRFAYGKRAAIGFHDIPMKDGEPVQTLAELGTPQSHGCIRQARPDARALWHFAIVGTKVVVTA